MNELGNAIETLSQFLDEYMDLIYNPDERLFIDLERIAWFEELEASIDDLKALAWAIDQYKESHQIITD